MALVLASKSPRRRELMQLVTPVFDIASPHVDESVITAATPARLAGLRAAAKAQNVAAQPAHANNFIIGCDTVVELDGHPIGKPANPGEAIDMISLLSGKSHYVHTGIAVFSPCACEPCEFFVETSEVTFSCIPQEQIQMYAASQEPYDKAGGYGIQGWAARFIPRIEGCYYNVMGLPVAALYSALRRLGLA